MAAFSGFFKNPGELTEANDHFTLADETVMVKIPIAKVRLTN